ncbi:4-hydroxybenzoate polyprenyl transferase [Dacryopinax primogenitus]|uniref:4-hydroxybenzoate polyprenyltransferase, mitochondrial n=1 Tax=Dacryopinax primogenitus (strain DJM 731) TaxID=1858805 RepID=M5G1J5_DACPD|nr:4-hydroxybenzoate polyprenyl transferase [Dacryopinax primogenitus]EJT99701.1 4-hydroxybenzoate polyprenyl transferase [Dacryopinax primogenitus]
MSTALYYLTSPYFRSLLLEKPVPAPAPTPGPSQPSTPPCSIPSSPSPSPLSLPLPSPSPNVPQPQLNWPLRQLLEQVQPYLFLARVDNPAGTLLLWLPFTWSVPLAANHLQLSPAFAGSYTLYFGLGSLISHCMGCTVNDIADRELDRLVERTKHRPLPSGTISLPQALLFLLLETASWFLWLSQLNTPSFLLGTAYLPLVVIYPYMKRLTYWPQAFLGVVFNWGALLGYTALADPASAWAWDVLLPLYGAGCCWTIVYDTIYAHQDKTDDRSAGIKSTALLFEERTVPALAGFTTLMLACLTAAGHAAGLGPAYYALSVVGGGVWMFRTLWVTEWDNRESCRRGFEANVFVGLLVTAGVWADYVLSSYSWTCLLGQVGTAGM